MNKKLYGYGSEANYMYICNEEGKIEQTVSGGKSWLDNVCIERLQRLGYEVESTVIEIVQYNVGDTIENWDEYINIPN